MAKHINKKAKKKLKIKDPKRLLIFLLLIIIIIVAIKPKNSKSKDYISLIIQNEDKTNILQNDVIINNDIVYLSLDDVKKCLDPNIYVEDKKVITTSEKKVAVLEINSSFIEINGAKVEINGQAFSAQDVIYIPISDLKNVYDIDFKFISEYKNIVIDYYSRRLEKATTTKNVSVKSEMKIFSSTVEKIKKGDEVVFISEQNGWAKIRTNNGNIGFVKKNKLTNFVVEREDFIENQDIKDTSFKIDITNKNISNFEKRKGVIEEIFTKTLKNKKTSVKIVYSKEKELEDYQRFAREVTAYLKECGITTVFE